MARGRLRAAAALLCLLALGVARGALAAPSHSHARLSEMQREMARPTQHLRSFMPF
jgi:hypothetical protein